MISMTFHVYLSNSLWLWQSSNKHYKHRWFSHNKFTRKTTDCQKRIPKHSVMSHNCVYEEGKKYPVKHTARSNNFNLSINFPIMKLFRSVVGLPTEYSTQGLSKFLPISFGQTTLSLAWLILWCCSWSYSFLHWAPPDGASCNNPNPWILWSCCNQSRKEKKSCDAVSVLPHSMEIIILIRYGDDVWALSSS